MYRLTQADDLSRLDLGDLDRLLEEPTSGARVPACGDEHVDDLAELVDRSVDVSATARRPSRTSRPPASDLPPDVCMPGRHRPGAVLSAAPTVDGGVVGFDTPLDQQFLDIAV
jgi:hypothetical protein